MPAHGNQFPKIQIYIINKKLKENLVNEIEILFFSIALNMKTDQAHLYYHERNQRACLCMNSECSEQTLSPTW